MLNLVNLVMGSFYFHKSFQVLLNLNKDQFQVTRQLEDSWVAN